MGYWSRAKTELSSLFIAILIIGIIIGVTNAYDDQTFICDKTKDTCYYTTFGIQNMDKVKISEIDGITIKVDQITVTRGSRYNRRHEQRTTYMPTLITKSGKTYPFYKSPTQNEYKAIQDKADFSRFMKGHETTLELKNLDNFNG